MKPDKRELQIDALHAAPLINGEIRGVNGSRLIIDYERDKVIVEYAPDMQKAPEEYDLNTAVLSGMPAGYYAGGAE